MSGFQRWNIAGGTPFVPGRHNSLMRTKALSVYSMFNCLEMLGKFLVQSVIKMDTWVKSFNNFLGVVDLLFVAYDVHKGNWFVPKCLRPQMPNHVRARIGLRRAVFTCLQCWYSDGASGQYWGQYILSDIVRSKLADTLQFANLPLIIRDFAYSHWPGFSAVSSNVLVVEGEFTHKI